VSAGCAGLARRKERTKKRSKPEPQARQGGFAKWILAVVCILLLVRASGAFLFFAAFHGRPLSSGTISRLQDTTTGVTQ